MENNSQQYDDAMNEFIESDKKYWAEKQKNINSYKAQLKGLINVSGLFKDLSENGDFEIIGIYDIEKTDRVDSNYPNHEFAKIVTDSPEYKHTQYMRCTGSEIRGIDHYYIKQWSVGMEGDSYEGYILYPLKNGKYFMAWYSC